MLTKYTIPSINKLCNLSDEYLSDDDDDNFGLLPQYSVLDGKVKSSLFAKKPMKQPTKSNIQTSSQRKATSSSSEVLDSDTHASQNTGKHSIYF